MEFVCMANGMKLSRIGLGTWSIGGTLWGGSNDKDSLDTINKALEYGINLIDTAPVYGLGHSEEIIGKALKKSGERKNVIIATKAGLEWNRGRIFRNSSPKRLLKEVDDSLRRLQTDYIDIYQVHWPDPLVPIEEVAETLVRLKEEGKIRAIGVSNYSIEQMEKFMSVTSIDTSQPPYNLFEREIERNGVMDFCNSHGITMLLYGVLCRGLLSGKISKETVFRKDDIRKKDPKFQEPRFSQYLEAIRRLDEFARKNYGKNVLQLAVRWVLDKVDSAVALWGARKSEQLSEVPSIFSWKLSKEELKEIEDIVEECVKDPVGPEFMAPPSRG